MFKEPLQVPRGAKILSTAWYDNSHGNRSNPNANAEVKWGDQTWEEMQYTGILFSPVAAPTPVSTGKQEGGSGDPPPIGDGTLHVYAVGGPRRAGAARRRPRSDYHERHLRARG